jgi:hypothetical protein
MAINDDGVRTYVKSRRENVQTKGRKEEEKKRRSGGAQEARAISPGKKGNEMWWCV